MTAMVLQACPVCQGTGLVSRPPWVAGDQAQWSSTSCGPWPCRACSGAGVLAVPCSSSSLEEVAHVRALPDSR